MKKKTFILIVYHLLLSFFVYAQSDTVKTDSIYTFVEEGPSFPGDKDECMRFFNEKLQDKYSHWDFEDSGEIRGVVFVSFVIEPDGSVTNIQIENGLGDGCNEEVLRVIRLMPKWNPGKHNGKAVRTKYYLPVSLSITEEVSNNDSLVKSLRHTFSVVEEFPSYPGGEEAKSEFFNKNMIYPEVDKKNKIQGTVFVTFIVCSDGQIRNVYILRGLSETIDAEALRLANMMPKWNPGKMGGNAVNVQFNMAIKFSLNKESK